MEEIIFIFLYMKDILMSGLLELLLNQSANLVQILTTGNGHVIQAISAFSVFIQVLMENLLHIQKKIFLSNQNIIFLFQ